MPWNGKFLFFHEPSHEPTCQLKYVIFANVHEFDYLNVISIKLRSNPSLIFYYYSAFEWNELVFCSIYDPIKFTNYVFFKLNIDHRKLLNMLFQHICYLVVATFQKHYYGNKRQIIESGQLFAASKRVLCSTVYSCVENCIRNFSLTLCIIESGNTLPIESAQFWSQIRSKPYQHIRKLK